MREHSALIPLRELSQTQLIGVIHRLQDKLEEVYRKSDAEVRRENQRLHTTVWSQFAELETIAEVLIAAGYPDTRAGQMSHSIRKMVHKLKTLETA